MLRINTSDSTSSVKRHFETNHKSVSKENELIITMKGKNKQSTSMLKYAGKNFNTRATSYSTANVIDRYSKFFQEKGFLKEV